MSFSRFLFPVVAIGTLSSQGAFAQTLSFDLLDTSETKDKLGEVVSWFSGHQGVIATQADLGGWGAEFTGVLSEAKILEVHEQVEGFDEVTGVAADPTGKKVAAMAILCERGTPGVVAIYREEQDLAFVEVGHHPDSLCFSADGKQIFVACEAEYPEEGGEDFAGSLAVIDLDEEGNPTSTTMYDFSAENLAEGVSLEGLRNQAPDQDIQLSLEPEYVAEHNGIIWVSLQEANALAAFDLETRKWKQITSLGTLAGIIDASKKDGLVIDDEVVGLPMPDTIAVFEHGGQTLIATANEGDARPDDFDVAEIADGAVLDEAIQEREDALKGLEISSLDGDTDGDGDIDLVTTFGTRSWSLWSAEEDGSVSLVWDSGSLESVLAELDPEMHNVNRDKLEVDNRSDDKGPEPEALATGIIDGKRIVFVGLERQNGITAWHVPSEGEPELIGYINEAKQGRVSPESFAFVAAEDSPTEQPLLLVGFEGGKNTGGTVAVYAVSITE